MSEVNNEFPDLKVDDMVTGEVVKLEDNHVLVDIGYKTEGIVPIGELSSLHVEVPGDVVSVGDSITLKIKKIDDDEVVLSKKAVDAEAPGKILKKNLIKVKYLKQKLKKL